MKALSRMLKLLMLISALFVAISQGQAHSQTPSQDGEKKWPDKRIRIVVGFPAGSLTDTIARLIAEQLATSLGQAVVVENKPGANGAIGVGEVARATPDGYTLLVTNSSSITINPQLYKQISYTASDFAPVFTILEAPFILTVNPDWAKLNDVNTAKDLVEYSRRHPEKLSFGSAGQGNISHLMFVSLSNATGIKTTHVPYKSASQSQLALISGELDANFDTLSAIPVAQSGKVKALAVTANKRLKELPDLPTMAEAGFDNFEILFWMGLLAPAGTPEPIVQKIYESAKQITSNSRAMSALTLNGEALILDPVDFKKRINKEVPQWGEVIRRERLVLD
ncbi:tripartite-type tricarboxylate transporter receptor subunit TctC [Jezberella montanilacus]|jgi:tripartite-type tricarboxylate transporter receptor subunit TctC|uniref:Tripartite-type tricarboxylate transporter receptor subunit TctC n=1 Tax=Jezberella montanilacus TaxID=323426 RepID=A0A2T0XK31_9BURK|nr:tripartite tricarboxylate transporter substrate binding protein [Jezberella montanilacus]PRY99319.1 tripartite-type tricarboxylate transporter receptor subunit TctC [Jezberella montanilacus]